MEKSNYLSCTCHTKRVTKSDGTASGVKLFFRDSKDLNTVSSLTCESFIDLEDINIFQLETSLLKSGRDCDSRANSHDFRWNTCN